MVSWSSPLLSIHGCICLLLKTSRIVEVHNQGLASFKVSFLLNYVSPFWPKNRPGPARVFSASFPDWIDTQLAFKGSMSEQYKKPTVPCLFYNFAFKKMKTPLHQEIKGFCLFPLEIWRAFEETLIFGKKFSQTLGMTFRRPTTGQNQSDSGYENLVAVQNRLHLFGDGVVLKGFLDVRVLSFWPGPWGLTRPNSCCHNYRLRRKDLVKGAEMKERWVSAVFQMVSMFSQKVRQGA